MKRQRLLILVVALALFAFLAAQDALARIAWQKYRSPAAALFLDRHDAALAMQIGNYYFNVGNSGAYDLKKAKHYFERAIERDPDIPSAWHQLARIEFLRGNFPAALEKINTQIALHGDTRMASYYIRGLINGYAGNFADAEMDFKKFLAWDATNWAAHNDLAWVYFRQGKFAEVESITRRGLAFNPENPWLLTSLGIAELNQDRKGAALDLFERAQRAADNLDEADWQRAYPGNDPRLAGAGLANMKKYIALNLELARKIP